MEALTKEISGTVKEYKLIMIYEQDVCVYVTSASQRLKGLI